MTFYYNIEKLKGRRAELRNGATTQEVLLWARLRRDGLGVKFRRQFSIGGYIVDFYCQEKRLIIEIDGSQHLEEGQKDYDEKRSQFFENFKIKVLRFSNKEINTNIATVILKIQSELNSTPPL